MFEAHEIETLIASANSVCQTNRRFSQQDGQAICRRDQIERRKQGEFDFGQDQRDGNGAPVDFTGQQPVGKCPKCGNNVFEMAMHYNLRKSDRAESDVRFSLRQIDSAAAVERAQWKNCSPPAKTDLLDKFISKRNRPSKPSSFRRKARSNSNFSRA